MKKYALSAICVLIGLSAHAATEYECHGPKGEYAAFTFSDEGEYSYVSHKQCTGGYYGEDEVCLPDEVTTEYETKNVDLTLKIKADTITEHFTVKRINRQGNFYGSNHGTGVRPLFMDISSDAFQTLNKYFLSVFDSTTVRHIVKLDCSQRN